MKTLLFIYCIVFGTVAGWQQGENLEDEIAVEAIIEMNVKGNQVHLTAIAENHTRKKIDLRYALLVQKNVSKVLGNKSSNKQGGMATLNGLEQKRLSVTKITKAEQDEISLVLKLYDLDGKLLHKKRIDL